ncbi:MAG: hypothetical protein ACRD0F_09270 [Acidimicrobiales bacterium]
MTRAGKAVAAVLAAAGLLIGAAGAASGAAVHEGGTEQGGTETFDDLVPCLPDLGTYSITITFNGVFQSTENQNGGHFTFTQTGSFSAVPAAGNSGTETFTGRFTVWGGGNFTAKGANSTFTFRANGTGSEGSSFKVNEVSHITTDGPGDPFDPSTPAKVAFERSNCR